MITKLAAFLLLLVLWCYVALVHSYGRKGYNPMDNLMKNQMKRKITIHSSGRIEVPDLPPSQPVEDFHVYREPQVGLKTKDKIISLPGQPKIEFDQYSGYVTVDDRSGRELFYYFVECTSQPSIKPLVLWLNGGPGCSSFGAGAMMELGPFRVKNDGKTLVRNPYAWNNKANIIFLESPVGVGFSFSRNVSEYQENGDTRTAQDSYTFLINWFERFPEYKDRDFYIAGESYAGHYVPQLAQLILHRNEMKDQNGVINLRGIVVGNGLFDFQNQLRGTTEFFYSHAIISEEMRDSFYVQCNFSSPHVNCSDWRNKFDQFIDDIDIYDVYAPLCDSTPESIANAIFDPCTRNHVIAYLNTPEVQKALHANTTGLTWPWNDCSDVLGDLWHYSDRDYTVLPIIKELMATGIRLWLFSGDTDGACPVTATEYSIKELGAKIKTNWHRWFNGYKEIGGYAVEYENLTYITVRGSGHFVPSYQPIRALTLFSSFLEGKLPPQSNFPQTSSQAQ